MNEIEKINREFAMIGRDLTMARESLLLRIIRNKRQPLASRFAALLHFRGLLPNYAPYSSEESMGAELRLFLAQFDSGAL